MHFFVCNAWCFKITKYYRLRHLLNTSVETNYFVYDGDRILHPQPNYISTNLGRALMTTLNLPDRDNNGQTFISPQSS